MRTLEGIYRRVTARIPGRVAGQLDLLRPSLRSGWGGPLNGQRHRQAIVREVARTWQFDRVIETGTFRGTGAEFFATLFGVRVTTIEINPRYYAYSRRLLGYRDDVEVRLSDSRIALRELSPRGRGETGFFYLDAHWENDLPLHEELAIITGAWGRAVVLVDDFEVPGDAGYGFDDYGPGMALTEEYLPKHALKGWTLAYPSLPSSQESGARRGSCLLISPDMRKEALQLTTVRVEKQL